MLGGGRAAEEGLCGKGTGEKWRVLRILRTFEWFFASCFALDIILR